MQHRPTCLWLGDKWRKDTGKIYVELVRLDKVTIERESLEMGGRLLQEYFTEEN